MGKNIHRQVEEIKKDIKNLKLNNYIKPMQKIYNIVRLYYFYNKEPLNMYQLSKLVTVDYANTYNVCKRLRKDGYFVFIKKNNRTYVKPTAEKQLPSTSLKLQLEKIQKKLTELREMEKNLASSLKEELTREKPDLLGL